VHRSADSTNADFRSYRNRLDEIDDKLMELLVQRMAVSREIGAVKREKGLTVFQPFRYNETIERYTKYCKDGKIDIEAVRSLFEAVHSESIRQQLRVVNEGNE
jgi:chorismate mutase